MILEIEMTNWRAYEHHTFKFKPGLNFIMGPNGRGKTSILEAISYGLTGEVSVVTDRNQLLRDPEKPAMVILYFEVQGRIYRIERTQLPSKTGEAAIYDTEDNRQLAYFHKNVTEKVEELIGISADFLRRIVYMAEGDVFRFLKDPPGKALNHQVQRVLGLTQLDLFYEAIKAAKSELRDKAKELKSIQERISELSIEEKSLDGISTKLGDQRDVLLKQILEIQEETTKFEEQNHSILELKQIIDERLTLLQNNDEYWSKLKQLPLVEYFDELQRQISQQQEELSQLENNLARQNGQQDSFQRVSEILSVINDEETEVVCPVCRKPMTRDERLQVVQETNADIERIGSVILEMSKGIARVKKKNKQTVEYLENLREIRNTIVHNRIDEIRLQMSIDEITQTISLRKESARQKELEQRKVFIQAQLDKVESERANYVSIKGQLEQQGFTSPSEIKEVLVQIETRQLSLNAAKTAVEKTLADMRDVQLVAIYKQIADVWNNFLQHGKWRLRFDVDGKPILAEENEHEFDFGQFSGGEKTALLVVVHTVIAHYFSQCNFLLVDEPLEHLDQVNRRSLMRFFMAASKNKFFQQALITTYEESLVRKYISEENVNVLYIH
jgi:DNA repair exonuclease SbcCD ATPase subunit